MNEKTKDSVIAVCVIAGGVIAFLLNYLIRHDVDPYAIGTAGVGVLLLILAQHPRS